MIVSKSYGSAPVVQLSFLTVIGGAVRIRDELIQAVELALLVLLRPCTKFPLQVTDIHETSPMFAFS